jgi:HTH-like domain
MPKLIDKLLAVRSSPEGLYGRRKMTHYLCRQGLPVAFCTVDRPMRDLRMNGVRRGKWNPNGRPSKRGEPSRRPGEPARGCPPRALALPVRRMPPTELRGSSSAALSDSDQSHPIRPSATVATRHCSAVSNV